MILSLLSLFIVSGLPCIHVPHDDVHGVATTDLASGVRETVITTQRACRVFRTRDQGLSWQPVNGGSLELARADVVAWDSHPSSGRFLIGSNLGIWAYDPTSGLVSELNSGLGTGDSRYITSLATPAEGSDGPVLIATRDGVIHSLNRTTETWDEILNTGNSDLRGQVAIYPHFLAAGPTGKTQTVAAAMAGILYLSEDGGGSWSIHSQFSTPSTTPTDPLITAISIADDYPASGNIILATSVENLSNFTGDEGTLWHSGDFGGTFSSVLQTDSSIRTLQGTPPSPSGVRWFLAAVLAHPNYENLANSDGIFRSSDGGLTWDDFGSAQDFVAEDDAGATVSLGRELILDFEVSPTFSTDGEIYFGRSEGLFRSRDEGLHWIPIAFRPAISTRGLDSFVDGQGELWVAMATYGSGSIIQNLNRNTATVLEEGPIYYQDEILFSPNFSLDGTMVVGGSRGIAFWLDPSLQASNPFGVWGWTVRPNVMDLGYSRFMAFSPHFDGRGTPGSDQTLYFSTSTHTSTNYRSADGGLTGEILNKMIDGSPAPWFLNLLVAPTYDASTAAGRTDVYGSKGKGLVRLHDKRWRPILALPARIESMALAPDFDRDPGTPGRPLLFVGMDSYPYFGVIDDSGTSPIAAYFPDGLETCTIVKVACPPDFATRPLIYIATFADGVKKLDLSQPLPVWETVGLTFPEYLVDGMALSHDFANDRLIMLGTQRGLLVGRDAPGSSWTLRESQFSRDNHAPAFRYYQPNHPDNPQPERPWRWELYFTDYLWDKTDISFRDFNVAKTNTDGSYVEFTDYARALQIHTFRGPLAGTAVVTIENATTGVFVASQTVDLNAAGWSNQALSFDFPFQPVQVRMEAQLDPGEELYLDGVSFFPF